MIPSTETELTEDFSVARLPSKTYRITENRIAGYADELEAMQQAIRLILETERFTQPIFSWNYGTELADLFGVTPPLLYVRLQERIEEALLQDDRITGVSDFTFTDDRGNITVSFQVETIFGTVQAEKEFENV